MGTMPVALIVCSRLLLARESPNRPAAATSGSRRKCVTFIDRGGGAAQAAQASAFATSAPFAIPDEGGWLRIPARNRFLQPGDHLRRSLRVLARQGTPDDDALDRLRHVQPG